MWQQLKKLLAAQPALPEQWQEHPLCSLPLLGVDLELTGLDPAKAGILSIGWVQATKGTIPLDSSYYKVIQCSDDLQQSPVIHGLIEEDVAKGDKVEGALEDLLGFANSHVWVFHNVGLDMAVIQNTCAKLDIPMPTITALDTLQLEVYQLRKHAEVLHHNAATLQMCRQRHNLPVAPAHNALDDAMATLELLYAQLAKYDAGGKETLGNLAHTGAVKVFE